MTHKNNRVVITGLGAVTPNALGVPDFKNALEQGISGIQHWVELEELNFKCQIGGKPALTEEYKLQNLPDFIARKMENNAVIYACLSGLEAWKDAGFSINENGVNSRDGVIMGSGAHGLDTFIGSKLNLIDQGNHRRLGSRSIPEAMSSGAAAFLNSIIGFGGRILSNSSACITGSEAILQGFELIQSGKMERMLCGSTEGDGRYIWGGFDAMRVLCSDSNDNPIRGSRPMSSDSSGFVPGGGSGSLVLESLESAQERGAKIYAEILGGEINTGGQRNGGTMTAPNSVAVVNCIRSAMEHSDITSEEIDLISGHLTSTKGDPIEVDNWKTALGLPYERFPYINTPKSMIGHCIAAAGSIELVACALQLHHGFIHPNLNIENVHPEIEKLIPLQKIPNKKIDSDVQTIMKSNFGFGDLNCCIVLRKWNNNG